MRQGLLRLSLTSVRLISDELRGKCEELARGHQIVIFMKGSPERPMCGFSQGAIRLLEKNGCEELAHFDILEDESIRQGMKEYSNWMTFPQVYVKGEFVGGFDLLREMDLSGELAQLILSANKKQ